VYEIEKHHLRAISQSDFLWIHAPDGYIGTSTALEIGYALALQTPIFSSVEITDQTLRQFIQTVPSVFSAITSLNII
jgi:nucleoside 2-deoxyribosyltransferase